VAKAKQGEQPHTNPDGTPYRAERDWFIDQCGDVPPGWAARAFKLWFTPKAARDAVQGEGRAAQAYRDYLERAHAEEGAKHGQEA
jgi:hypothetical protein